MDDLPTEDYLLWISELERQLIDKDNDEFVIEPNEYETDPQYGSWDRANY